MQLDIRLREVLVVNKTIAVALGIGSVACLIIAAFSMNAADRYEEIDSDTDTETREAFERRNAIYLNLGFGGVFGGIFLGLGALMTWQKSEEGSE